ncbi:MAG: hypothetical protein AAB288_13760, partial [Acidobacteriota bacterium]
ELIKGLHGEFSGHRTNPANVHANLPGPLQRHCTARNQNAAPVKLSSWFGPDTLSVPVSQVLIPR